MYDTLRITTTDGTIIEFHENEWDDYRYDGRFFSILKRKSGIAMYNCNNVYSLELLRANNNFQSEEKAE